MFALNRKALGRSLNKAVPVSVVGIFSYDGAQVRWRGGAGLSCSWKGVGRDGGCLHFHSTAALSLRGPSVEGSSVGGLVALKAWKCDSEFNSGLTAATEEP